MTLEYLLTAALAILTMLGVGTTLSASAFRFIVTNPRSLLLVLGLQWLACPLLALGLGKLLGVSAGVAVGMLFITSLPGGTFSNLCTVLAKGNVALSVAATTAATFSCILVTPFILQMFQAGGESGPIEMPVQRIFSEIAFCLLIPLISGMLLHRWKQDFALRFGKICLRLSLVNLAVLICFWLSSGQLEPSDFHWRACVALVLYGFVALWMTYFVTHWLGFADQDRFAMAIEVVLRNCNLGLLLKAAVYPSGSESEIGQGVLFALLFYSAYSLGLSALEVAAKVFQIGPIYGWRRKGDTGAEDKPKGPGWL